MHLLHELTPLDAVQGQSPPPPTFLTMVRSSATTDNVSFHPVLITFILILFVAQPPQCLQHQEGPSQPTVSKACLTQEACPDLVHRC
jgi:hypothetical protein